MSTPKPNVVAAVGVVRAVLAGHSFKQAIRGLDHIELIAGLVILATILGEKIVGPDRPDMFDAALAELEAYERITALFDPEEPQ